MKIFYGNHSSEFMDVYWPTPEKELHILVVLIHGGFFKRKYGLSLMHSLAKALRALGYTVVNLEYPRVGENQTALQMIESVFAGYDLACSLDTTIKKCFVVGHSAGGYYAEWFAMRSSFLGTIPANKKNLIPTAVIPLAPVSDLLLAQQEGLSNEHNAVQLFVESNLGRKALDADYQALSPSSYGNPDCPIHIIHGTHDIDVPLRHSINFADGRTTTYLHRIEGDHYDIITPSYEMMYLLTQIITTT